jgi:nicotinamide-nucleotide amidase
MRAEILTIGDELCRGEILDTNSAYLAERLWDLGITTRWMTSCNDDEADLRTALAQAAARADVVVCSGGLGPTEDDLTVDVVAGLAGVSVEIDDAARLHLEARFAGRLAVTPIQLRQVRVPAGARVHGNPGGLAPCFELPIRGTPVICLPGFPREIRSIFEGALGRRLEELRERHGSVERIARRIYRAFGRGESQLSEACRGLLAEAAPGGPRASIHYQVKFPEVLIKLVVRHADAASAEAQLASLDAELRGRLGPALYGTGDEALPALAVRRAIAGGVTIATAESCTGGLIGELITACPGASGAYLGGAIAYSNAEKERQLGVAAATLADHGAVSQEAAVEMAIGARARLGADLAVATTGIAGPGGGSPDKPVGTVWLALAHGPDAVATRKLSWPGARDQVRTLTAWWALAMIDAAIATRDATASPADRARARWVLDAAGAAPLDAARAQGSRP